MRISTLSLEGEPSALAAELRGSGQVGAEDVTAKVAEVIAAVREGGDAAVAELSRRFDGVASEPSLVSRSTVERAAEELDPNLRDALGVAIANVGQVATAQLRDGAPIGVELPQGQRVEIDEVPVSAAAVYAPGGRASYPSSVLMGVIPARVAGVERVVVASPPGADGLPAPPILAAAALCGADQVVALGGAQAIAALAYGTETIAPVDLIAGPGSPWVQEAKLQCSRVVGSDGWAGPSELVVIADRGADERHLALDLMAQAEHGDDGLLVVISPDASLGARLARALEEMAPDRPTVHDGTVSLVGSADLDAALALAEALAPEHLQIDCAHAAALSRKVRRAGCVLVGSHSATAFGDYAAGSNHILPTGGAGRFSGPLGPGTFRRAISRVSIDADAATALAPTVETISAAEGFAVHGESARARGRSPASERE